VLDLSLEPWVTDMKDGKRLKILYIHQYFTTREGSSGTRSYEFSKYLISQGHRVTMISGISELKHLKCLNRKKLILKINIEGIDTIVININYSNYMGFIRRIWAFFLFMVLSTYVCLKAKKHDLVFASSTPLTVGIPAVIVSKTGRIPFIFELRDLWPEFAVAFGALKNKFLIKIFEILEYYIYRNARKIVVISKWIQKRLIEKKISADKLTFIPIGADISLFVPSPKENCFRAELELSGKFVVLYVGAHGKVNDLRRILDAAIKLKQRNDIVFIFVGDGKEKSDLVKQSEKYQLKNVIFLDAMPRLELPKIIAAADVCLISGKNTYAVKASFSNKLFDYLSTGRPTLINFDSDTSILLEKHQAGISVEPDNPKAMAGMILKLKDNPKWCEEMGKNARRLAEKKFDRIKLAEKLESTFKEVINAKNN